MQLPALITWIFSLLQLRILEIETLRVLLVVAVLGSRSLLLEDNEEVGGLQKFVYSDSTSTCSHPEQSQGDSSRERLWTKCQLKDRCTREPTSGK